MFPVTPLNETRFSYFFNKLQKKERTVKQQNTGETCRSNML